jgi:hypothetical protein
LTKKEVGLRFGRFFSQTHPVTLSNKNTIKKNNSQFRFFSFCNASTKVSGMKWAVLGAGVQGCQIFLGTKYQNGENIPNNHKIYQ